MKILQINNVYGEKSTGKITKAIHLGLLEMGHQSVVVFGRGKGTSDPGVIRLCPDFYGKWNNLFSRFTGMMYGGCFLSTLRLFSIIRKEKPDVVHLQCINGYFVNIYRLIGWLKKHRIKTVVTLHAEFMYTANCGHAFSCDQWKKGCQKCPDKKKATKSLFFDHAGRSWRAMKRAFSGFESDCIICPVSPWTEARAREGEILKDFRFQTVYNGVDLQTFYRKNDSALAPQPEVLHVTAHFDPAVDHAKGGHHLISLAKMLPQVRFLVAGRAEKTEHLPENLTLLGEVRDQNRLASLYQSAWASVLVSEKETFSMPCAESLCCGTPVVGFLAGGPEQIALKEYSDFVPFGQTEKLATLLTSYLDKDRFDRNKIAEDAAKTYGVPAMLEQYLAIYRRV